MLILQQRGCQLTEKRPWERGEKVERRTEVKNITVLHNGASRATVTGDETELEAYAVMSGEKLYQYHKTTNSLEGDGMEKCRTYK